MTIMKWNKTYSVGCPDMDRQHQRLFCAINLMQECLDDPSPTASEQYHIVLHELAVYANEHFADEERMMMEHDILDPYHISQHEDYREYTALVMYNSCIGLHELKERQHLHDYLTEWWKNHVLETDMKYKHAFTEEAGKVSAKSGPGNRRPSSLSGQVK